MVCGDALRLQEAMEAVMIECTENDEQAVKLARGMGVVIFFLLWNTGLHLLQNMGLLLSVCCVLSIVPAEHNTCVQSSNSDLSGALPHNAEVSCDHLVHFVYQFGHGQQFATHPHDRIWSPVTAV